MSLISDALKKAHLEAAHGNREQHRFYMSHGGRHAAAPHPSRTTIVLAAAMGGCITAAAALVYLTNASVVRALPERETVASPAPAKSAPVASVPEPPARVERAEAAPPTVRKVTKRDPKPEVVPVEKPAVQPPVRETTRTIEQPKPAIAAATQPARTSRDGFVEGETYASPIRGPLGAELTLNGVSISRGNAVAIVNGNLVRSGAAVGPFIVEEIEPGRVRVRYVDVRFWVAY